MPLPSETPTAGGLEAAALEFMRARRAFAYASDEADQRLRFYRLRDLALAALDLCRTIAEDAGVDTMPGNLSVAEAMRSLFGQHNAELAEAIDTLSGLTNAHVFTFMADPPDRILQVGHAASSVVGEYLDWALGDTYAVFG